MAAASGGKCGQGALSGAAGALAAPLVGKFFPNPRTNDGDLIGGTAMTAVIGGVASMAGGGKFGNGAVTAAFGYLFNQVAGRGQKSSAGGRPLTEAEKEIYRKYGSDSISEDALSIARIHEDGIPFLIRGDADGFTFYEDIYFKEGAYTFGTARGVELLGHELVHLEQFLDGMTPFDYLGESLNQFLKGGEAYTGNTYEVDAYNRGTLMQLRWCQANPTGAGCR